MERASKGRRRRRYPYRTACGARPRCHPIRCPDQGLALPRPSAAWRGRRARHLDAGARHPRAPWPAHAHRPRQRAARADHYSLAWLACAGRHGWPSAFFDRAWRALPLRVHGRRPGRQLLVPCAPARPHRQAGVLGTRGPVPGQRRAGSCARSARRRAGHSPHHPGSRVRQRQPVCLPGRSPRHREAWRGHDGRRDDGARHDGRRRAR